MEYCERASSIKSISDLKMDRRLKDIVEGMEIDEIILAVRNGDLINYISRSALPTGEKIDRDEWWIYLDMINDLKDELKSQGYIRRDIDDVIMPERYFAEKYAIPCGLLKKEVCQPYFYSNRSYETYDFGYDRLRLIINILEDELRPEYFKAVKSDIMYADRYCYEGNVNVTDIINARQFLIDNHGRLRRRFGVCWL